MKVAFCGAVDDFRAAAMKMGVRRLAVASPQNGAEWAEALVACDLVVVEESGAAAFAESFSENVRPNQP
jgi:hypothetical protein